MLTLYQAQALHSPEWDHPGTRADPRSKHSNVAQILSLKLEPWAARIPSGESNENDGQNRKVLLLELLVEMDRRSRDYSRE